MISKIIVSMLYFAVVFYLGYKGWQNTRKASDYMLAGRRMNPFVMAMSYGATFISTSAIIGFGGAAGLFGFSLLWLTVANVFIGIFLAMTVFGRRTRRMGLCLNCHTFPELLGRRFDSSFIQGFSGLIIFLFIPVYAAAVLIGISRMLEVSLNIPYDWALIGMTAILAVYVVTGGLKAVMYTDAFQGAIMMIMMLVLLYYTYTALGGVTNAHQTLTDMAAMMPEKLQKGGMLGWTQGAKFGTPLWLVIYTTIIYGVGIGVLAQPQLAVRFMTVKSDKQLNRAVLFGGVFIPLMTGVAFIVGALSNAVFTARGGKIAIAQAGGNIDKIIPTYIEQVMPDWFAGLFLLGMFAAAMSTLSSQYHVGGTSLGRDVIERGLFKRVGSSAKASQIGVTVTILATLVWAWVLPESVIARATAFFFGLCAASFLPVYLLGLYWKGITKVAAKVSMVGGFAGSMLWLLFVHEKEAAGLGICQWLTGQPTLVSAATKGSWVWLLQWVDPNVVALPVSFLLAVGVSLMTKPMRQEHLEQCWANF
jgi:SSS family solute:Na+ symporter